MTTLSVTGELTVHTAAKHADLLLRAAGANAEADGPLEVHLADVTELDTAGLQLLLLAKRRAELAGASIRFTAPSQVVRDVLELVALDPQLNDAGPEDRRWRTER
jgi:anti-anti-sigma factor